MTTKDTTINRITNTATTHPALLLAEAMTGGPGAIERQEARGQAELVNSAVLPVDRRDCDASLIAAGVIFGDVVKGDPMFQHVTLPGGWKKAATDHSMWSELLDETGGKRAMIFYKAAFYDRSSHMHLCNRYATDVIYNDRGGTRTPVAKDGDAEVWRGEPVKVGTKPWEASAVAQNAAKAWLDEHYPDWRNPNAYRPEAKS